MATLGLQLSPERLAEIRQQRGIGLNDEQKHHRKVSSMTPEAAAGRRRAQVAVDIQRLVKRWPECFDLKNRRPLKIGIDKDIRQDPDFEIPKKQLSRVLGWYSSSRQYLDRSKEGVDRIELTGEVVDTVTAKAAAYAAKRLAGMDELGKSAGGKPFNGRPDNGKRAKS